MRRVEPAEEAAPPRRPAGSACWCACGGRRPEPPGPSGGPAAGRDRRIVQQLLAGIDPPDQAVEQAEPVRHRAPGSPPRPATPSARDTGSCRLRRAAGKSPPPTDQERFRLDAREHQPASRLPPAIPVRLAAQYDLPHEVRANSMTGWLSNARAFRLVVPGTTIGCDHSGIPPGGCWRRPTCSGPANIVLGRGLVGQVPPVALSCCRWTGAFAGRGRLRLAAAEDGPAGDDAALEDRCCCCRPPASHHTTRCPISA